MSRSRAIEPWPTPGPTQRSTAQPGSIVTLDPSVRELEPGLYAGGYPFRLLRVSPQGRTLVARWAAGEPLGTSPAGLTLAQQMAAAGMLHLLPAGGAFTAADVTFVIPVRDRPDDLDRLLSRLRGRSVIVVDDGSEAPAVVAAVAQAHGATVLPLAESIGPAGARNRGAGAVTTALTFFLDSDVVIEAAEDLDALLAHFDDPAVAMVAPRIVGAAGTRLLDRFEMVASPLDVGRSPAVVRPGSSVSYVPSAALIVRTSLGPDLFDERLRGGEDVDLVWRFAAAGHLIRFDPAVTVGHPARATLREWLRQRTFYGTTASHLAQRHGDLVAPVAGSGWSVVGVLSVLLGWPLVALGSFGTSALFLRARLSARVSSPMRTSIELVGHNAIGATPSLARHLIRAWSPAMLLGALWSRRIRRAVVGVLALSVLDRRRSAAPTISLLELALLGTLDDLAYSAGLWAGAAQTRRAGALRPRLVWRSRTDVPGAPSDVGTRT